MKTSRCPRRIEILGVPIAGEGARGKKADDVWGGEQFYWVIEAGGLWGGKVMELSQESRQGRLGQCFIGRFRDTGELKTLNGLRGSRTEDLHPNPRTMWQAIPRGSGCDKAAQSKRPELVGNSSGNLVVPGGIEL
jgi:hypothetical protein